MKLLQRRSPLRSLSLFALLLGAAGHASAGELDKGHRILVQRGLQIHGMVNTQDLFNLDTYRAANYTAVHWIWTSNPAVLGRPPGAFPWARWVHDPGQMPYTPQEKPFAQSLVALQFGDEQDLNNPEIRERVIKWFDAARGRYPNVILFANNFGGQVNDQALDDFIGRARPDMLAFDTYPWRLNYHDRSIAEPAHGSPWHWYSDLRRYRVHTLNHGIPMAVYRQTFYAVQDYDHTVYRNPSQSEMNLNTFAALALGAKCIIDFTYNTGASSLFDRNEQGQWEGDRRPNERYHQLGEINRQALHLGPALVRLRSADVLFIPGEHRTPDGGTELNNTPIDMHNKLSDVAHRDPHLRGWSITNLGDKNHGLRGDVLVSWFKVLDETFDGEASDEWYFMVTNGLCAHDATGAQTRQRIQLNFANDVPAAVQRHSRDTGKIDQIPLEVIENTGGRRKLVIELDGGAGDLFKFNTGAPFVGTGGGRAGRNR